MLASVTSSVTSFIGNHGLYAVFVLMVVDAVFPAASELVMLYAGALAVLALGYVLRRRRRSTTLARRAGPSR